MSLPAEWTITKLQDLATDISYGYTASSTPEQTGPKMLRITDIQENRVAWESVPYCVIANDKLDKYRLRKNDLLFARTGATVGKSFLIRSDPPESVYASYLIRVRTPSSDIISLLAHFFNSEQYWQQITEFSAGIGQPNVNGTKLKGLDIPLPPLLEQKVIADKLDSLLAQVETIKARLDRLPDILKRFRQSVLAAAVSGRLTEDWRKKHVTEDWEDTVFSKICTEITVGFVGKMSDRYREIGIPFLRSQNVRAFRFSPKNLLYISENFHNEIYKSRLEPGDLAIVRSGAPGTTCVIPDSLGMANCSDLVIARPSSKFNSDFGCIFMNSEVAQKNVADNQVGVAQQHFNVGSMKKMPISLPSLAEQVEIVRRVEQLFAYADNIEQKLQSATDRVNNLTQSILAKAFCGELTKDWREANPDLISGENSAAALLEKIKVEREALKPQKRAQGRRVKV